MYCPARRPAFRIFFNWRCGLQQSSVTSPSNVRVKRSTLWQQQQDGKERRVAQVLFMDWNLLCVGAVSAGGKRQHSLIDAKPLSWLRRSIANIPLLPVSKATQLCSTSSMNGFSNQLLVLVNIELRYPSPYSDALLSAVTYRTPDSPSLEPA
ncbi:hypothetical protein VTL71DRAFT_2962 [Oculimacula yallundae]|uniref:Uncharacterized protein n=1 Tax=Oculimacula yallundae TaxID=86028 RepID=A0ABR4C5S4_9HELO